MSGPSSTRREAVSGGVPLTRREAAVLDIIREVARVHRPCPPNAAFAARISSPDVPGISHVMRSLQAKGAITVVARGPLPRVITLLDGSGATYDPRAGTEPSAAGPTPASLKAGTAASNPGAAAADDAADEGDESDAGADEIPLDIWRGFEAPPPTTCQFIHGEPRADADKCGRPVFRHYYCRAHYFRCYDRRSTTAFARRVRGWLAAAASIEADSRHEHP